MNRSELAQSKPLPRASVGDRSAWTDQVKRHSLSRQLDPELAGHGRQRPHAASSTQHGAPHSPTHREVDPASSPRLSHMDLVKSKQRVVDHGEVFTPAWLVEDMLDLVKDETERIDSRFLEPACGSGNFVIPVLRRKLSIVHRKYAKSDFENRHHALFSLMCIYGIELLADNVAECRQNLLDELFSYLGADTPGEWLAAAGVVVDTNIVHGDAIAMTRHDGAPITFSEWSYIGRGQFQRRDFGYDTLTQMSSFAEDTLFGHEESHDIFTPSRTYPLLTVAEIPS